MLDAKAKGRDCRVGGVFLALIWGCVLCVVEYAKWAFCASLSLENSPETHCHVHLALCLASSVKNSPWSWRRDPAATRQPAAPCGVGRYWQREPDHDWRRARLDAMRQDLAGWQYGSVARLDNQIVVSHNARLPPL
jgi:hypothetical protein